MKPPPEEFAHVLLWYKELRNQTLRGYRYEPMQIGDLVMYRDAFEIHEWMGPFEFGLMLMLDGVWRKAQPEPSSNDNAKPKDRPPPPRTPQRRRP